MPLSSSLFSSFGSQLQRTLFSRAAKKHICPMHLKTPSPKKAINLLRGWPNPSLLPTSQILTAATSSLTNPEIAVPGLLYGPDPGFGPLRREVAKWLGGFFGRGGVVKMGEENICITGGASQNLACVLQVFADPVVSTVWMVAPGYFLAETIFEDSGLRIRCVGEGRGGIDVERLEEMMESVERQEGEVKPLKNPKPYSKIYRHIIYCVPTFSNPSGKTMSLSTRIALVNLARKHDALIITDDVYDFLQFPLSPGSTPSTLSTALEPRLIDVDRTLDPIPGPEDFGNAMSNGSFSKIAGPGVRTGWNDASPKFTYALSQCGSSRSGGAPSQLVATMMYEMLRSGSLEEHIEKVLKPAYKRRYEVLVGAIERVLVPLGASIENVDVNSDGKGVFGGYFVWVEFPRSVNANVVADRAREEENLIVAPGPIFEVRGDKSIRFPSSLRLCFAWEEEADLEEGVTRLGRVVERVLSGISFKSKGEKGLGIDLRELK